MYIELISIASKLTKAQRTRNWWLHLAAVSETLPSLHRVVITYVKSAYLYLQSILKFQETNTRVYNKCMQGYHVARRSDAYFYGPCNRARTNEKCQDNRRINTWNWHDWYTAGNVASFYILCRYQAIHGIFNKR